MNKDKIFAQKYFKSKVQLFLTVIFSVISLTFFIVSKFGTLMTNKSVIFVSNFTTAILIIAFLFKKHMQNEKYFKLKRILRVSVVILMLYIMISQVVNWAGFNLNEYLYNVLFNAQWGVWFQVIFWLITIYLVFSLVGAAIMLIYQTYINFEYSKQKKLALKEQRKANR